jgi:hypothetical protein
MLGANNTDTFSPFTFVTAGTGGFAVNQWRHTQNEHICLSLKFNWINHVGAKLHHNRNRNISAMTVKYFCKRKGVSDSTQGAIKQKFNP